MKTRLFLCALILPLAAMAARPRSVTLVIQETGLARISETHDLEPPGPDGLIRIAPLPATLVPASVTAVPIERGESLDILAQRFAWDLLDNESLFRAYRGATIVGRKGGETIRGRLLTPPDFSDPHPALVLAADDPAVRLVPNLLELDAVEFPARPELARTPTLVWQLADGRPPPAAVQLHYAASGITWAASHEAILAQDNRSLALSTRIQLQNRAGRDFAGARIRLALTDKGQFAPLVPPPNDPRAGKSTPLRYSADGLAWVPERTAASAAIVATYDLPFAVDLSADGEVLAGLSSVAALPVDLRRVYDGVRFDRYQRNRRTDWNLGTESAATIDTRLTIRNEQAAPMPPGELRLLRGQADGALEWIGNDWLPALPPGETATLNLGPAAGLQGRRVRTGYSEDAPRMAAEESFEITLENQTPDDQTIVVVEHLYRGDTHEIIAASAEHVPGAAPHSIEFEIPVKAGTQKSFTYTVRYTW
ncbi:MAG: hypothetical protein GX634_10965 [Lentisphaerae bacterium]|nr:hypothetical protein [Lentisphaerota bacterium]